MRVRVACRRLRTCNARRSALIPTAAPRHRSHATLPALSAVLLVVAAAIAIVNPQRELLTWDDGWAYARSVVRLLSRGEYTLDQWSAANMPVQIGIAAMSAFLFGYSLTLLRWTTLALLVLLLISFFYLLRAIGCRAGHTMVLTLGLLASPVVFALAFTFMSDVQFLSWLILALYLYCRGLESGSARWLLAGSLAAACAIGTRQFGVAIFGGWVAVALFARRDTRLNRIGWSAALLIPIAMTAWQLNSGTSAPNFTQAYRLAEQRVLLSQPPLRLMIEAIWRLSICLQYLAGYLIPVTPLTIGLCVARWRRRPRTRLLAGSLTFATLALVAFGLHLNSPVTVRPPPTGNWPWPALGMIWVLPSQPWASSLVKRVMDMVAFSAIAPLAWLVFSSRLPDWRSGRPKAFLFLTGGTAMSLFALLGGYVQLNDTYVIALVPFSLLALGYTTLVERIGKPWLVASGALALSMTGLLAVSLHYQYDEQQVAWDEAERALQSGVPAAEISGPKHWAEYHGAFDDWIAAGTPGLQPPPRRLTIGSDPFHDPFYAWLTERNHRVSARGWTARDQGDAIRGSRHIGHVETFKEKM